MILRRITEHVKAQNWTAVALDFIIVVVGVFMGIQLGNWNEARGDQQRGENYRDRLTQEMTINRKAVVGRQKSFERQIEFGLFAMEATTKPADRDAAWEILRAFFQASHAFTITLQRGTYDEIISSGDLALLGNQKLVNALSEFYTFSGFSTIDVIPDYRENLRRIIPFELQLYFQTQCYEVASNDIHFLLDCPPPEDASNLIELATELQSDDELKRDLQYMLSYAGVSGSIARNLNRRTDEILALLTNESNSKGN